MPRPKGIAPSGFLGHLLLHPPTLILPCMKAHARCAHFFLHLGQRFPSPVIILSHVSMHCFPACSSAGAWLLTVDPVLCFTAGATTQPQAFTPSSPHTEDVATAQGAGPVRSLNTNGLEGKRGRAC